MRRLRRFLLVVAAIALGVWLFAPGGGPEIAEGSVLVLDLEGEMIDAASPPLFARFLGERGRPFASVLSELAKAERDERLDTVVLRIRSLSVGWAKAQELRAAIAALSKAGRRTAAYLELASFGANLEYYVASAADEVFAAPATRAPVVGLAAEYLFLGGLWERLGIEVEVERIGRYKSAAESFAGREMSEATREMANSLLDSVDAQFVQGIAEGRDLPEDAVRRAIAAAPIDPAEMQHWGLLDGAMQLDGLIDHLGGGEVVEASDYASVAPSEVGFEPEAQFALVYGSGNVVVGEGRAAPDGSPVLASDTVAKALEEAAEDPEIDAIIFRIDSPGGSPLASDIVWRATQRVREQGKPIVASFSDVAASGGYYVAAGVDGIVASPASITGSIGVFVLRPVIGGALEKLDIGFESLVRGRHADLQLATRPLSPPSRERLRAEVRSIYDLFVQRVAEGREREVEQVDAVARGRVWTGSQALEAGLVDELGGLRTAVNRAKRQLSLDEDADVALVVYPPPRSLAQQLAEALGGLRYALAPTPLDRVLARARPWLRAVADGTPAALLPFSLEIR
jgi:protease-4